MEWPYLYIAPPLFVLWIYEIATYRGGVRAYPWTDVGVTIVLATLRNTVSRLAGGTALYVLGNLVYPYRWFDWDSNSWATWFAVWFGVEFAYYWFHRMSHQIRWLWAEHSVHHTATQLVLWHSLRLGILGNYHGGVLFFMPLVLLGVAPELLVEVFMVNLVYQTWIHTDALPRLGPFEWVFNTPAHHRVHHASNRRYWGSNFGGTLIVFDRCFGTFQAESDEEPVVYGPPDPLPDRNPWTVLTFEWRRLFSDLLANPRHALGTLFRAPGWRPEP